MRDIGIIRKIDELGRIVIPKEIRDKFKLVEVELFVKGENIIVSKFNNDELKELALVREIDELGRLVIPMEIRKKLEIEGKDPLEICFNCDKIILKKHKQSCVFCGCTKKLTMYKDKFICDQCKEIIKSI